MRLALRTMIGVGLVSLAASAARAEVDPVEQLFQDSPRGPTATASDSHGIAGHEPVSDLFTSAEEMQPAGEKSSPGEHADSSMWNTGLPAGEVSPQKLSTQGAPDPPATPVSPVPEPSAILLALAALVYFLLFGRRRRVI